MQLARLGAGAQKLMFFGVKSFFGPLKTTAGTPMALYLPLATTLLTESQGWNLRYHNHNDPIKIIDGACRRRHAKLRELPRKEKSLVFKKKVHTATIEFVVHVDLIARM